MPGTSPTEMEPLDLDARFATAREGSTLVLPPGRHVIESPIVLTKSLNVRGASDGSTVLDGGRTSTLFQLLGNGNTFSFQTLTFQSGYGRQGGAFSAPNRNAISFEGCRFADNVTEVGGGAAVLYHARGYFRRCIFERNVSLCGGALGVGKDCDLLLDRCVFVENRAEAGGAIFVDDSAALEIKSCTFVRNVATRSECGNAIFVFGTATDGPSSFIANTIFAEEGDLSGDAGGGMVFVTHSVVPVDLFPRKGFKDVGRNVVGPVELVDLGAGAWALDPASPAVGGGDVTRIEAGAVDICGASLIQGTSASPGALAPPARGRDS
jgi:Right handed beta helix region